MERLHLTEFASPQYFEKLRSLEGAADHANASQAPVAGPAAAAASQPSTFTLPLGNPRPPTGRRRRSNETVRSNDGKRRSLGLDLISFGKHRKPSFTTSMPAFRFKSSLVSKAQSPPSIEHDEFLYEEEPLKLPYV